MDFEQKALIQNVINESLQRLNANSPDLITEKLQGEIRSIIPLFSETKIVERRDYAGARQDSKTFNWTSATDLSANMEGLNSLQILKNRARDLFRNNPYVRKYHSLMIKNVIGSEGIKFQSHAVTQGKKRNTIISQDIEDSFNEWTKKGNCTVCGKYNFRQVLNMAVGTEAIDGESPCIVKVRSYPNEWGFALQILDSDRIDLTLNSRDYMKRGNSILMGIETNKWGRPVNYWVLNDHPGDWYSSRNTSEKYKVYNANDVIHYFDATRPEQTRGIPPLHAVMMQLRMLGEYEKAQLISAQIAACQMGFITQTNEVGYQGGGLNNPLSGTEGKNPESKPPIKAIEPGIIEVLANGQDFKEFKPNSPSATHDSFMRSGGKWIASGLDVSYAALTNNYADANFASLRISRVDVNDTYRIRQADVIDNFCEEVFNSWFDRQFTMTLAELNVTQYKKLALHSWQPRGLSPEIDPLKELKAKELAISLGLTTASRSATEYNGSDFEDNIELLLKEAKAKEAVDIITKKMEQKVIAQAKPEQKPKQEKKQGAKVEK